jgi:hypothetical protein
MLADIAVAAMWVAASAVVVTPAVALVEAATVVVAVTGKLVLNREKARLLRQAGFLCVLRRFSGFGGNGLAQIRMAELSQPVGDTLRCPRMSLGSSRN